eukprot:Nitzschia sp. Nitz4//scaffold246_size28974//26609//27259//NITZ4_008090-RA/size28974-processed-gene-0.18-mRNA-1//-1//CDS//3329543936//5196//frame0
MTTVVESPVIVAEPTVEPTVDPADDPAAEDVPVEEPVMETSPIKEPAADEATVGETVAEEPVSDKEEDKAEEAAVAAASCFDLSALACCGLPTMTFAAPEEPKVEGAPVVDEEAAREALENEKATQIQSHVRGKIARESFKSMKTEATEEPAVVEEEPAKVEEEPVKVVETPAPTPAPVAKKATFMDAIRNLFSGCKKADTHVEEPSSDKYPRFTA